MDAEHKYTWTVVTSYGVQTHENFHHGTITANALVLHVSGDVPADQFVADAYWAVVESSRDWPLLQLFHHWLPYFCEHLPLTPPPEPLHVTLSYDPTSDLTHQSRFNDQLEGQVWEITVPGMVLGPEGVVAPSKLTPEQSEFYKLGPHSAPHLTLAIRSGGQAKCLGPTVAKANDLNDWEQSDVPKRLLLFV